MIALQCIVAFIIWISYISKGHYWLHQPFSRAFVLSKGTVRFREGVKNLFADLFVKRVPGTVHPSVYGINLSTETVYGFGGISCPCLRMEIFKKIAQQPFSPKKKHFIWPYFWHILGLQIRYLWNFLTEKNMHCCHFRGKLFAPILWVNCVKQFNHIFYKSL